MTPLTATACERDELTLECRVGELVRAYTVAADTDSALARLASGDLANVGIATSSVRKEGAFARRHSYCVTVNGIWRPDAIVSTGEIPCRTCLMLSECRLTSSRTCSPVCRMPKRPGPAYA